MRWRPRRTLLLTLGVLVAAGAAVVIWSRMTPDDTPLAAEWEAVVAVAAGDGVAGMRDGHAMRARFSEPFGIVAAADGSLYVSDAGEAQRIRRLAPDGTVSTVAGGERGYVEGAAPLARFDTPSGLAMDAGGSLYIADTGNNALRRITPEGLVATVGGDGVAGHRDGPAQAARFNGPVGVAVDGAGRVIVADTYNDRIRAIEPGGTVSTVAGAGQRGWVDGLAAEARFDTPCGVAVDGDGNIYVADTGNGVIRRVSPEGVVTTVEPHPPGGLVRPVGIAATGEGVLYVTDERGTVVEITPGVGARTVAGSRPGFADGTGAAARFRVPSGVASVAPGRLAVADTGNALVRLVAARSHLEFRLPPSPLIAPAFDAARFNLLPLLWPFDSMEGPFEITGTMGESRGPEGDERFHAGLDVSGEQGLSVLALRDGVVARPLATAAFGTLNESIRIGPITYVHLRVGRRFGNEPINPRKFVPSYDDAARVVDIRVRRGTRVATGERIGTLNAFNHAHINVGWPGEEHNPLRFRIPHFQDTVRPTIAPSGVQLFGEDGERLTRRVRGRLLVDGQVQIVVDGWDQVDGNLPRRRLGLYSLGYQVLRPDGSPAPGFERPRATIVFDRFSGDDRAARLVFAAGSGIPEYGSRRTRFLYVVTNTFRDGVASPGYWDTRLLPPGDYIVRILAADIRGNLAVENRDVAVTIESRTLDP